MANNEERKIDCIADNLAEDKRIDIWLSERFTYFSRHQWQNIIKNGFLTVNKKLCRPSKKLKLGDLITYFPQHEEPEVNTDFSVIYEDERIIAINKPPNLPCHPAGPYFKHTLWYSLKNDNYKIHFINRLDRETSGIMLIAKNSEDAGFCAKNIISKTYITAVFGDFPNNLTAEGFLFEDKSRCINDELKVRKKRFFSFSKPEVENVESTKTIFNKIKSLNKISILKAELFTGRMHQIRATLCSLGFPVVGDKLYGPDESIFIRFINDLMTEEDKFSLIMSRQALHSESISFIHPKSEKIISLTAPVPNDISSLYNN